LNAPNTEDVEVKKEKKEKKDKKKETVVMAYRPKPKQETPQT
jgi:hypothetical protein